MATRRRLSRSTVFLAIDGERANGGERRRQINYACLHQDTRACSLLRSSSFASFLRVNSVIPVIPVVMMRLYWMTIWPLRPELSELL